MIVTVPLEIAETYHFPLLGAIFMMRMKLLSRISGSEIMSVFPVVVHDFAVNVFPFRYALYCCSEFLFMFLFPPVATFLR